MVEVFVNGYCRRQDMSLIVAVELEGNTLQHADCHYGQCEYEPNCPIAARIRELAKAE